MSRQSTDLRPSVVKMTIKNPLPNISPSSSRDGRDAKDTIKPQPADLVASKISKMYVQKSKQNEKPDNTEQLMKEIEKWRHKFTVSQKSLEEARADLKFKEDHINSLTQKIKSLTSDYKKELQAAKEKSGNHSECKKEANILKAKLSSKEKQFDELQNEFIKSKDEFEAKMNSLIEEHQNNLEKLKQAHQGEKENMEKEIDKRLSELKEIHKKEMSLKDEKLQMMKKQIADVLTGSSMERQQQIEELLKELKRVSDEAETVKAALRNLKSKDDCQKCVMYQKKCKDLQDEINSKEVILNDLVKICSKMEKQLTQHDDLMDVVNKLKKENDIRRNKRK